MDERDRAQFWKITAIGILLVVATAVITGLVVANRTAPDTSVAAQAPSASPRAATQTPTLPAATSQTPAVPPAATETPKRSGVPPQEIVSACNRQAAAQAGSAPRAGTDKAWDVGKDAGVGALGGAAVGAAAGGVTGALVGMGIPEYEAKRYESKLKEGNILISVHSENSDETKRAKDIFNSAGASSVTTSGEAKVKA